LAVSSVSPNKDIAWEFIQFLSESARLLKHARSIGALPSRLTVMDVLFEKSPGPRKVFWDSFGFARRLPHLIELGSVEQIIYKMGGRILSLIREQDYTHKRLQHEILSANNEVQTLLSVHRYSGASVAGARA
jgi:hypothetical protein